jgi:hypothetical protein
VRTAILDAFQRASGDILATVSTGPGLKGVTLTQQGWYYPFSPQPGDRVRIRGIVISGGSLMSDGELAYTLPKSRSGAPLDETIFSVDYQSRTWYRGAFGGVTAWVEDGPFSPSEISGRIASGAFRIAGNGRLNGRQVIKLVLPPTDRYFPAITILWVDARTYVTLRADSTVTNPNGLVQHFTAAYEFLPATERNLALLTPPVPAGFTHTSKPASPIALP